MKVDVIMLVLETGMRLESFLQVNAVTGSLFTSEVMQSAAQEVTQEEAKEVKKDDAPAGDQVCIIQCTVFVLIKCKF